MRAGEQLVRQMEQTLPRNAGLEHQPYQTARVVLRTMKSNRTSHLVKTRGMFDLLDQSEIGFKDPWVKQADEPGEGQRMRVDTFEKNPPFKFLRRAVKPRAKQAAKFLINGLLHNRIASHHTISTDAGWSEAITPGIYKGDRLRILDNFEKARHFLPPPVFFCVWFFLPDVPADGRWRRAAGFCRGGQGAAGCKAFKRASAPPISRALGGAYFRNNS